MQFSGHNEVVPKNRFRNRFDEKKLQSLFLHEIKFSEIGQVPGFKYQVAMNQYNL